MLQDIADLHALAADPEFLVTTEDHTSPKWLGSKAPCDPYVISLTDRRSRYTRKGDAVSAARVLGAWVQATVDNMGQTYAGTMDVQGYAAFLVQFLAWVCQQPAIERFARHVSATHGALVKGVAA